MAPPSGPGPVAEQADLAFEDKPEPPRLSAWAPDEWPVDPGWAPVIQRFLDSPDGQQLAFFIKARLAAGAVIYPPHPLRALELTPLSAVKVVILGQDPYHGPEQAQGLAFSVGQHQRVPPSLRNMFKELDRAALGQEGILAPPPVRRTGSLEAWARQGVLLLNTCLTVEDGAPGSHARRGWEALTDALIQAVASAGQPVVFMLWGAHAQTKRALIHGSHLVLAANHPSPLSARRPPQPFLGCGHFASANDWLLKHGHKAISW